MKNEFKIEGRIISKNTTPFILAEMACSHDGSVERAIAMVNGVANAGVDGIQFQLFSTDKLLTPNHSFYNRVKELELSFEQWAEVISLAKSKGLIVFVNVLETSGLDIAMSSGAQVLKIHSADISNPDMLNAVANTGLPVSLSTGGSTVDEVHIAINELKTNGIDNLILMHGYQAFPTQLDESHLNYINTLEHLFGLPIGYQDHVDGESELAEIVPLLAMGKGAVLLEKHVTDDRSRKGTDYESALEPDEFRHFVSLVHNAWSSFGVSSARKLSESEHQYRKNFKKSIVAASDIEKGEIIKKEMLLYMRGDKGLAPTERGKIIGKKCIKPIKRYESVSFDHIQFNDEHLS